MSFKACVKKYRGSRLLLSLCCWVRVRPGYLDANSVEFDADSDPEKYHMQKVKEQKWEYPFNKSL
jgi:hypothetical protein